MLINFNNWAKLKRIKRFSILFFRKYWNVTQVFDKRKLIIAFELKSIMLLMRLETKEIGEAVSALRICWILLKIVTKAFFIVIVIWVLKINLSNKNLKVVLLKKRFAFFNDFVISFKNLFKTAICLTVFEFVIREKRRILLLLKTRCVFLLKAWKIWKKNRLRNDFDIN